MVAMTGQLDQLRTKIARLSSLIEVGAIISSSLDLNEVLHSVMSLAQKVMEAETCSVLLLNEETGQLEFEMTLDHGEDVCLQLKEKIRLDLGQGVAGWAALHRRSVRSPSTKDGSESLSVRHRHLSRPKPNSEPSSS